MIVWQVGRVWLVLVGLVIKIVGTSWVHRLPVCIVPIHDILIAIIDLVGRVWIAERIGVVGIGIGVNGRTIINIRRRVGVGVSVRVSASGVGIMTEGASGELLGTHFAQHMILVADNGGSSGKVIILIFAIPAVLL